MGKPGSWTEPLKWLGIYFLISILLVITIVDLLFIVGIYGCLYPKKVAALENATQAISTRHISSTTIFFIVIAYLFVSLIISLTLIEIAKARWRGWR